MNYQERKAMSEKSEQPGSLMDWVAAILGALIVVPIMWAVAVVLMSL
jgi:hypothetical protein